MNGDAGFQSGEGLLGRLRDARSAALGVVGGAELFQQIVPGSLLLHIFDLAQSAATLLRTAGLHGHKYAIDAMLCATALTQPGRVTILTSDVEDITMLTADHPRVAAEKV